MESIALQAGVTGAVESLIGGRQENQDSYTFSDTPLGPLVVVCDGMGGGPAGKTASQLAADTIVQFVIASAAEGTDPAMVLEEAIRAANTALGDAIAANPALSGMGTTCVCVLFAGSTAYIGHVGDSRCYVLRKGKVKFRTNDHSQVAELVRMGSITEEQARVSPYSNIITRAIGIQPDIEPEIDKVSLKSGDRLCLMSDGIWGTVPEQILVAELSESASPETTVSSMTKRTDGRGERKGGKHDNLTLAVVDIESAAKKSAAKASEAKSEGGKGGFSLRTLILSFAIAAVVIGVGCFYLGKLWQRATEPVVEAEEVAQVTDHRSKVVPASDEPSLPLPEEAVKDEETAPAEESAVDEPKAEESAKPEAKKTDEIVDFHAVSKAQGNDFAKQVKELRDELNGLNNLKGNQIEKTVNGKPNPVWKDRLQKRRSTASRIVYLANTMLNACPKEKKSSMEALAARLPKDTAKIVLIDNHGLIQKESIDQLNLILKDLDKLEKK